MRKVLVLLLAPLAFILSIQPRTSLPVVLAQVLNPLTRGAIGGIPECKDSRVFCVGKQPGAEYSVICGATCDTVTSTCTAGSAVTAAKAVDPNVLILVGEGVWDECVSLDNIVGAHLKGSGIDATIIRPSLTTVDGGAVRIANATTTTEATKRITVSDLTVQNDSFPEALEAALNIGNEAGFTSTAWNDILLYNLKLIGAGQGFNYHAVNSATETNVPRITVRDSTIIAGRQGMGLKFNARAEFSNLTVLVDTAYCESTVTAELSQQQGVVASGTDQSVTLAASESAVDDFYAGRRVHFVEGAGAGTCPAECTNATTKGWSFIYTGATKALTLDDVWPNACVPTSECDYVIQEIRAPSTACTDVDWTVIAAPTLEGASPHISGIHTFGVGAAPSVYDYFQMRNSTITLRIRDMGLDATQLCGGEGHIDGILGYTVSPTGAGRRNDLIFDNVDIQIDLDMDVQDNQTCNPPVACVHFSDDLRVDGKWTHRGRCIINNNADPDISVAGFASNSDDTGTLTVADAHLQLNGTSGAETYLFKGGTSGLTVGNITANEVITTSGTLGHLSEMGAGLSASAALDFNFGGGSDQGTCLAAQTITVTGAAVGDLVRWNLPNASHIAGVDWKVWVSATNTVSVLPCCVTAADCADTPSGTWAVRVEKP